MASSSEATADAFSRSSSALPGAQTSCWPIWVKPGILVIWLSRGLRVGDECAAIPGHRRRVECERAVPFSPPTAPSRERQSFWLNFGACS
jgi:hypothetical protein